MKFTKVQISWLIGTSILFPILSIFYKALEAEYGHRGPEGQYLINVNDPYIIILAVLRGLVVPIVLFAILLIVNNTNKHK